ncbi:HTH_Tnp_Tc3_2 domain-containing protein [Trichonephila clavipes]|nr:HTH_Tnp_Tc3_2 domain-containing protein [Trichonephila clavipes]
MTNIYADDTSISATYKNHLTITKALNAHILLLEDFFNTWKIKINVDKTVAVLFTRRRKPCTPPTLYSTPLHWSQSTKYLGLVLEKNLSWKQHIIHTRDKFRNAMRSLYPLICRNSHLNIYNKVLLYTAVLRPVLAYGCPVWGYAANSNIKLLDNAQNALIRNITNAYRYNRNRNIYKVLNIPTFKAHIKKLGQKLFDNLPNISNVNIQVFPVAQWIARWTSDPKVGGSNPAWDRLICPRRETSIDVRKFILRLFKKGKSYREIAKIVGRSHSCVQKIIGRFKSDGLIENKCGRGRKSILSDVAKRKVLKDIKIDPKLSGVKLAAETSRIKGRSVSAETVRNVIRHAGYSCRVARKKLFISLQNQKKRLEFAKTHQLKTDNFWKKVTHLVTYSYSQN